MQSVLSRILVIVGAVLAAIYALMTSQPSKLSGFAPESGALPALGADLNAISTSGISSGAYMAGQFQFAHARHVVGAAIIAGGPYGCAESVVAEALPGADTQMLNLTKAVNGCMLDFLSIWGTHDAATLAEQAKARAQRGEIDPLADVMKDRVYLFSGKSDHTVVPGIVQSASDFYKAIGVPEKNIKFVADYPAGHAFVTEGAGNACEVSSAPYVVHCGYDQAGDLLAHIYGPLNARAQTETGDWLTFEQTPFAGNARDAGLARDGVVYVPKACRETQCRIHIAFHGCAQNKDQAGDAFIKDSGFARWADTNALIVLFPQVRTGIFNPQACWDWWGYTGADFLTRSAPQITAVWRMVEALAVRRPQS